MDTQSSHRDDQFGKNKEKRAIMEAIYEKVSLLRKISIFTILEGETYHAYRDRYM